MILKRGRGSQPELIYNRTSSGTHPAMRHRPGDIRSTVVVCRGDAYMRADLLHSSRDSEVTHGLIFHLALVAEYTGSRYPTPGTAQNGSL